MPIISVKDNKRERQQKQGQRNKGVTQAIVKV